MFDLSDRVILVTGGNGGIGLAMADACARAGARVAIWGTNPDKNAAAIAHLRRDTAEAEAWVCDVSDPDQVNARMADLLDRFGRLDGCIANAGVSAAGEHAFHEMPIDAWRRIMAINLDGVFLVYQAALKHMVARSRQGDPFGRLVCVSSIASQFGAVGNEHYAATKGALNSLTFALSVGYARHGITANAILPGWIETDMAAGAIANEKFATDVGARIPVRRWGQPDDFGGMSVYLMSEASSYHTGQLIQIDGGYGRF